MMISRFPWEIVMLEKYYIKPTTIDRIHHSWIASAVEQYVSWMAERRYTDSSVSRRIPIVVRFGEFAKAHGACEAKDLADHVEPSCKRGLVSVLEGDAQPSDVSRSVMKYVTPFARC